MGNPYTDRLEQLSNKQTNQNYERLSKMVGLPINKPTLQGQQSPSGIPTGSSPLSGPDESYKDGAFWQNFDFHRQSDPHFDSFSGELTKLSTGLREQVNAGYMPEQVAKQRVQQFVLDTFLRRNASNPYIQQQKKEQEKMDSIGSQLSQLAQLAQQNPSEQPKETPPVTRLSAGPQSVASQEGISSDESNYS